MLIVTVGFGAVTWQWRRAEGLRSRAEESDRQSREAVNRFFVLVGEEKLLMQPGLQPLRKKLLEEALEYYENFLRQRGNDPDLLAEVAETYLRLGKILKEIGSDAEALTAFEKARVLLEKLSAEHPADLRLRRALGESHHFIGDMHALKGEWDQGRHSYEQARTIREQLVQIDPGAAQFRNELAWTYFQLGHLLGTTGQRAE